MFDAIRKHQRLLLGALMLLILPALVLFGVSGYDQGNKEPIVAQVGDAKITRAEFDRALQQQLGQFRQFAGADADLSMFDTPELRKNLLENLIARKASEQLAVDRRVLVTDAMVQNTLMAIPALRNPDGSFNAGEYRARLAANNQTPAMFEAQLKRDLASQMLPETLGQSGLAPETTRNKILALLEEVRAIKPLAFTAASYAEAVKPTDDQLKAYYNQNTASFKTQESAKVEYLVLSSETIATSISLDADSVKNYYEQNKSRYAAPEQRRASHIFFEASKSASTAVKEKAKEAAQAVLTELKKDPTKFVDLAKTKSQDAGSAEKGGDLGFFARDGIVPALADAAFKMKEGELSELVESEDGFHIVKLTAVQKVDAKPFEAVKAEIEADLKKQQASKKFSEQTQQFTDGVYEQGDSLKPTADKLKLVVQTAQGVSRLAPQPGAGQVLSNPKLLKALFSDDSIKSKKNIEALEVAPGVLASARIVEYTPSATRPLEEVKAEVVRRVKLDEAKKQATAAGQAKLKELQGGAVAAGFGDGVLSVSRLNPASVSKTAVEAVFRASSVKFPAFVGVEEDGIYTIYQVLSAKVGDGPEVAQRKAQIEARADAAFVQQEFVAFTESIKTRSNVKRMTDILLKDLDSKAATPAPAPAK